MTYSFFSGTGAYGMDDYFVAVEGNYVGIFFDFGGTQSYPISAAALESIIFNDLAYPSQSTTTTIHVTLSINRGWNLISLPIPAFGQQYGNLASGCGSTAFWGYNGTYSRLSTSDAVDNYVLRRTAPTSTSSRENFMASGMWLYSAKQCSIRLTTYSASYIKNDTINSNITLSENLTSGWNMVSVPYGATGTNYGFAQVSKSCKVVGGPYGYDSATNSYYNATELQVGSGYFVYVSAPCSIDWSPWEGASGGGSPPQIP